MNLHISQVWFITGSSRGLGRALSEAALEAGHRLVASARNTADLEPLVQKYRNRIYPVTLDVTDPQAAKNAVQRAVDAFGRIDVLVNNAGYGDIGSIEDTSFEEIRAQIEANLFGVIHMTKSVLPVMREQKAGHIIQLSSVGGRIGAMGRAAYSAAKWGVEGFSEVLAKETAPLGIKVTIIEPGGFRTDFAGSSTKIHKGRAEYDSTVGEAARLQRDYNGKQPGDPAKAAAVILRMAAIEHPPLRLLLGSDAFRIVGEADLAKMEADKAWRDVSISTDFDPPRN